MNEIIERTTALRIAATSAALTLLDGSVSAVGSPSAPGDAPMQTFCYCIGTVVQPGQERYASAVR